MFSNFHYYKFNVGCVSSITKPETTALKEQRGNTTGNIVNGGLMAGDDDFIYYRSEADGWRLYRARYDGSGRQKLSDDIPAEINALNGWIYFANYSDGLKLYKIRTDGTDKTKLTDCQGGRRSLPGLTRPLRLCRQIL